ncbi:hypothetical protein MMC11_007363 [Xylographa trunciseda]|nr:hypothetical protein [Xylographa trunciseda]
MIALKKSGLPVASFHSVFGSLLGVKNVVAKLPRDVNPQYFPLQIRAAFPDVGSVFYFDNWPFISPILVVGSPATAYQATQDHSLPKYPALRNFFRPIAGEHDLVSMEGPLWKKWRGIFNPGFSASHLSSLVPQMVQEMVIFCNILQEKAEKQELIYMKDLTDNLTVDIIGSMVLDTRFSAQSSNNVMVSALRRQVPWLSFGTELNLWQRWHPIRPFVHWYNTRIMNQYVTKEVDARWAAIRSGNITVTEGRSVVDLALKNYMKTQSGLAAQTEELDKTFKSILIGQIKLFLFSGHDTTSTSVCYLFHILCQHPDTVERLREEHDDVLTSKVDDAPALLSQFPHLLNQLPLTFAVIKETLRLFPVASSTRFGTPELTITSETGARFPTDGCLVWSNPQAIQRDANYWPSPDSFIPERWLVPEKHRLYPVKGAYRPFEFGPRNCIGQELAVSEMKLILVMTIRRFDIRSCYEEWDTLHPTTGIKTVSNERAYMTISGGPSAKLPCRVDFAQKPSR